MSFRTQPCRATLRAVAVALLAAAAAGCAGTQKPEDIFWPYPPNKPRLKYVRTINGADGFDDRFMVKLRRMVAGATDENIVFNPNGVALSADGLGTLETPVV